MKILMLTTNSSLMDGVNRHILSVAGHVNRIEGCEVAVCTVFPRAELVEALEAEGVNTYTLNAASGHDRHVPKRFHRVMTDFKPDIVHLHVLAIGERIVLATLFRKVKYVCTVHGIADKLEHVTLRMRIEKWIYRLFQIPIATTCVVSNGVKRHLYGEGDDKGIVTVYNPIDFNGSTPARHRLHRLIGVDDDTPIIGTACRIAAVKKPCVFTEVFCKVLKLNERAHAVIIGDGDEELKRSMRHIVADYGVVDRVHWLGYRNDAPQLVGDLDCFVMTSVTEGMPTSLLEAMAVKVPFAMMEGDGGLIDIADLNREEGPIGIIAGKGEIDRLASGIINILDDKGYAKDLAAKAFEVGKRHFDVASVSAQLHHIYSEVIKNKLK